MENRWYVVQCKYSQEQTAAFNLRNQEFKVFVPVYTITKLDKRSIPKTITYPLFPSYIFVNFDVSIKKWRSINGTKGVITLMGITREDHVVPLPQGCVEEMIEKSEAGQTLFEDMEQVITKYEPGNTVEIRSGAFEGHVGTVIYSKKDRVKLLLALLNRKTEVYLNIHEIKPVD